jgi:hypothetical protein
MGPRRPKRPATIAALPSTEIQGKRGKLHLSAHVVDLKRFGQSAPQNRKTQTTEARQSVFQRERINLLLTLKHWHTGGPVEYASACSRAQFLAFR